MYDTSDGREPNPWKPGDVTLSVRIGYGVRCTTLDGRDIFWPDGGSATLPAWVNNLPEEDSTHKDPAFPTRGQKWAPLPRLRSFKNAAIVSDLFSNKYRLDIRHKTGLNVLYANGSAKFVPRKALEAVKKGTVVTFDRVQKQVQTLDWAELPFDFGGNGVYNAQMVGCWEALDKQ